jgi:regulator of replication initiation timing
MSIRYLIALNRVGEFAIGEVVLMDVTSVMATIKGAVSTVGKLRELTKKMAQVELKSTIAELANQLAEVQLKMADLKQQAFALAEDNRALRAKETAQKPKIKWGCFQFEGEEGLYCPACWDTKAKKHLTTRKSVHERVCSVCRTTLGAG